MKAIWSELNFYGRFFVICVLILAVLALVSF